MVIIGLAPGCTCWKKDLTGINENSQNLTKQRETSGDTAKIDVASNDDSLTEIAKYFAILIFAESYRPRNTAKIGRPRKFPRIRYLLPQITKPLQQGVNY